MKSLLIKLEEDVKKNRKFKSRAKNLLAYSEYLVNKDLPLLLEISFLSKYTFIDTDLLSAAILRPSEFYRTYKMPKRRGGTRRIDAPISCLLTCQKWLSTNILQKEKLHHSATAYRKGIGLLENITPHLDQKELLKIDLVDFFGSIRKNQVTSVFKELGYLPKMSYELASLCCLDNCLPQGAATSPCLSNITSKEMDKNLHSLAHSSKLKYTRYSDDITFSGDKISNNFKDSIKDIIQSQGFIINTKKTRHYKGSGKRIITGISVSDKLAKLPKKTKRQLKQDYYEIITKEKYKKIITQGGADVFFLESLRGRLAFWAYVEPSAIYPKKALKVMNQLF